MSVQCKTLKYLLAGLLTTLSIGMCQASENSQSSHEQSNLKKALFCMDILENRPDLKPLHRIDILRNECFSENYTQHSPHVADGRDAVLSLFERRF